MSGYIQLKKKDQVVVKINGKCSYPGRSGVIVEVADEPIKDDTITIVRLNNGKKEVRLRVLCFENKNEVLRRLYELVG